MTRLVIAVFFSFLFSIGCIHAMPMQGISFTYCLRRIDNGLMDCYNSKNSKNLARSKCPDCYEPEENKAAVIVIVVLIFFIIIASTIWLTND